MNARKVILFANTDWYLYHFRLSLASRLRDEGYDVVLLSQEGPMDPCFWNWAFVGIPFLCSVAASIHFGNFCLSDGSFDFS